jgi:hypothetical protein
MSGRSRPDVGRVAAASVAVVFLMAIALAIAGETRLAVLTLLSLIVTSGLLLEVDLPWGGKVPLGHALLIALAVVAQPAEAAAVGLVGIALAVPFGKRVRDLLPVLLAAAAADGVIGLARMVVPDTMAADVEAVLEVACAGAAYLAVDLVVARRDARRVWPLYVTLLCAAALLAVAYQRSPALSIIAAVPLLVTRYSFERFTSAREAYAQTTQALSLLPEVAGLTPLGHGERTAVYATALGEELGLEPARVSRLATAARLHHIGYISLHEPEAREAPLDLAELGKLSGDLLRETGFLADVGELVEQAQSGREVEGIEAAVIRVCSTLDDIAGALGDVAAADPFAEALRRHDSGLERTAAIALLRLHDRRPSIVDDARAASRTLAQVAAGGGAHDGTGHEEHGHDHGEAGDCR